MNKEPGIEDHVVAKFLASELSLFATRQNLLLIEQGIITRKTDLVLTNTPNKELARRDQKDMPPEYGQAPLLDPESVYPVKSLHAQAQHTSVGNVRAHSKALDLQKFSSLSSPLVKIPEYAAWELTDFKSAIKLKALGPAAAIRCNKLEENGYYTVTNLKSVVVAGERELRVTDATTVLTAVTGNDFGLERPKPGELCGLYKVVAGRYNCLRHVEEANVRIHLNSGFTLSYNEVYIIAAKNLREHTERSWILEAGPVVQIAGHLPEARGFKATLLKTLAKHK